MARSLSFALVPLLFAVACGSGDRPTFEGSGANGGGGSSSPGGNGGAPAFASNTTPASDDAGTAAGNGEYHAPTELGCSSRAQDILILDFRSGWWSGGGGGSFSAIALPAVVGACALTTVDYHHFETSMHVKCIYKNPSGGGCQNLPAAVTVDDIRASFEKKSVADYTQIWVLSGSDQDPSDIPVGDALFQGVVGDTKGACIPMLVAAGDGFVTHANTIAQDFGMGAAFAQKTNPPSFFSVSALPAQAASTLTGGRLKSHLLFTGVTSIVDHVSAFVQQAHGDGLAESVPGPTIYDVVAHDSDGNATIAVGAAKLAGDGYRPFIFDSGWQRMYALDKDAGTAQYLKNIVMYMGLVGCKAAPIGTPK